ncbi:hypothetical protein ABPG75_000879 [Micractinium tetrahymenae]
MRRRLPLLSFADRALGKSPGSPPPRKKEALCLIHGSNFSFGDNELADTSFTFWSLYARHHKYHYVRMLDAAAEEDVPASPGCARKWQMVSAVSTLLAQDRCELLLFLDLDVMIADFKVPLLGLLQRWGFADHHLIAQPIDPGFPWDTVHFPNGTQGVALNTGFMFFKDRPRTREIVEQWQRCPLGVWNHFIRPTLAQEEVLVLPCGKYVRHYWGWDGHAKATAAFREGILKYAEEAMLLYASLHGQLQQFT